MLVDSLQQAGDTLPFMPDAARIIGASDAAGHILVSRTVVRMPSSAAPAQRRFFGQDMLVHVQPDGSAASIRSLLETGQPTDRDPDLF